MVFHQPRRVISELSVPLGTTEKADLNTLLLTNATNKVKGDEHKNACLWRTQLCLVIKYIFLVIVVAVWTLN